MSPSQQRQGWPAVLQASGTADKSLRGVGQAGGAGVLHCQVAEVCQGLAGVGQDPHGREVLQQGGWAGSGTCAAGIGRRSYTEGVGADQGGTSDPGWRCRVTLKLHSCAVTNKFNHDTCCQQREQAADLEDAQHVDAQVAGLVGGGGLRSQGREWTFFVVCARTPCTLNSMPAACGRVLSRYACT